VEQSRALLDDCAARGPMFAQRERARVARRRARPKGDSHAASEIESAIATLD
jgi:hypothetical protein